MIRAPRVRNRPLAVALLVSALFHLSMVTLFSIGAYFEREPMDYIPFDIVTTQAPRATADAGPLRLEDPFGGQPEIDLPEYQFAEMARLRLEDTGLELSARFEDIVRPGPRDSWARFGQEVQQLQNALARLPFFGQDGEPAPQPPRLVSRAVPGFEIYVEWMEEPRDRQLIFSPPVDPLWDASAAQLDRPLTFVFRANPMGRIVEVMSPADDLNGLGPRLARAFLRYRFDPIETESAVDQHGTLIVKRADSE